MPTQIKEPIKCIWLGKYCSVGSFTVVNGEIQFDRLGKLPWPLERSAPATFYDEKRHRFLDFPIWVPGNGEQKERIRLFFTDLRGNEFRPTLNDMEKVELETLRAIRIEQENRIERLMERIRTIDSPDRIKRMVQDEFDFWVHDLKPSFTPNPNKREIE